MLNARRNLRFQSDILIQASRHIHQALEICVIVSHDGRLNKSALLMGMRELKREEISMLHVTEQNAKLLVPRQIE